MTSPAHSAEIDVLIPESLWLWATGRARTYSKPKAACLIVCVQILTRLVPRSPYFNNPGSCTGHVRRPMPRSLCTPRSTMQLAPVRRVSHDTCSWGSEPMFPSCRIPATRKRFKLDLPLCLASAALHEPPAQVVFVVSHKGTKHQPRCSRWHCDCCMSGGGAREQVPSQLQLGWHHPIRRLHRSCARSFFFVWKCSKHRSH